MVRVFWAALAIAALLFAACGDNSTGSGDSQSPAGRSIGFEGCKTFDSAQTSGDDPTDQACLDYVYDGQSVLNMTHVNAIFNCCPDSVGGHVRVEDNTIIIDEAEWATMPCDCICPFDVDYEIVGLSPSVYTIRVNEIYLRDGEDILEFTVDLSEDPSGSFCVAREIPQVNP